MALPKSCSCRCGPCPPPPSLVWVRLFSFFQQWRCGMWATFGVSVGACLTSLSRARHRESLSPPHRPNCCGGGRCSVSTAALKREGRILADFVPWHQPRRFCSSDGRAPKMGVSKPAATQNAAAAAAIKPNLVLSWFYFGDQPIQIANRKKAETGQAPALRRCGARQSARLAYEWGGGGAPRAPTRARDAPRQQLAPASSPLAPPRARGRDVCSDATVGRWRPTRSGVFI